MTDFGNRKGLTQVVSTVILIMLSIVFVAGVFTIVRNYTTGTLGKAGACNDIIEKVKLNSEYTCFDPLSNSVLVSVSRNTVSMNSLLVSVSNETYAKNFYLEETAKNIENVTNYGYVSSEVLGNISYDNADIDWGFGPVLSISGFAVGSKSNRMILVAVGIRKPFVYSDSEVSNITFNGDENFTLVDVYPYEGLIRTEVWKLDDPTSTTGDIIITMSDSVSSPGGITAGAALFSGVDLTDSTPTTAKNMGYYPGDHIPPYVKIVTSYDNSVIFDSINNKLFGVLNAVSPQDRIFNVLDSPSNPRTWGGGSIKNATSPGTYFMNWTGNPDGWESIAVEVKAALTTVEGGEGTLEVSLPGNESGKTYCVSGFSSAPEKIEISPKRGTTQCQVIDKIDEIPNCVNIGC